MILVAGRALLSFEKLKVTPYLNGLEIAFSNDDCPLVNSNPVIGHSLFLSLETS
jgi:hypothetical protein